jgi:hypothetical protein
MVKVFPWTEAQMLRGQKFAEFRNQYAWQTEFTNVLIADSRLPTVYSALRTIQILNKQEIYNRHHRRADRVQHTMF